MARASRTNVGSVDVENGIVVGLAVLGEDLLHGRVVFLACFVNSGLNHAPAAIGHHGALEGAVSLQTNHYVVLLADVTGLKSVDISGGVGVYVKDAYFAFLRQVVLLQGLPQARGLFSGAS